jgi:hypothetical protein
MEFKEGTIEAIVATTIIGAAVAAIVHMMANKAASTSIQTDATPATTEDPFVASGGVDPSATNLPQATVSNGGTPQYLTSNYGPPLQLATVPGLTSNTTNVLFQNPFSPAGYQPNSPTTDSCCDDCDSSGFANTTYMGLVNAIQPDALTSMMNNVQSENLYSVN